MNFIMTINIYPTYITQICNKRMIIPPAWLQHDTNAKLAIEEDIHYEVP
jgi:hypothetical protein